MDNKQKLIDIVKSAQFAPDLEVYILEDINKQESVTEDYILEVADLLERLGNYFKMSADAQDVYLDRLQEEASKVNGAMTVLNSIADELTENTDQQSQTQASVADSPTV